MARPKQQVGYHGAPLDALIGETRGPEDLSALFRQLPKRLAERIRSGELAEHPGDAPDVLKPDGQTNHRKVTAPTPS